MTLEAGTMDTIDEGACSPCRRLALITNQAFTITNFRGPLVQEMARRGVRVYALAPDYDNASRAAVASLGAVPVDYTLSPNGFNPWHDLLDVLKLSTLLRRLRLDATLTCFIKPVIYGTLAARLAAVPRRFAMIEGAGYVFGQQAAPSLRRRLLRGVVSLLYKGSLCFADSVFLLNRDDRALFVEGGMVAAHKAHLVDGIGLDLEHYQVAPPVVQPLCFIMAARLLKEKGVHDFIEAARRVKRMHPEVKFILLGSTSPNPDSVSEGEVRAWMAEGVIELPGHVPDVRAWIRKASVFVLPSYYREGLPRSTQEAMAMGRPVLTTDWVGCRETVVDGVNGFMVPVRDPEALAKAMLIFVQHPWLIAKMGAASRKLAEDRFDVHRTNQVILAHIGVRKERHPFFASPHVQERLAAVLRLPPEPDQLLLTRRNLMRRLFLLLIVLSALTGSRSATATVLVRTPGGPTVSKPDLPTANAAPDVAGKTVIVVGSEPVPADFVWRGDARLVVEKGGSIVVQGGRMIAGPFETGEVRIVSAGAGITKALPTAIGLPPVSWTSRVDTVDSTTDRNFGFVSQMITGSDVPPFGALDPQADKVAGFFAGYNGAHSAAFHTVINPVLLLTPADHGVVRTDGTSVTWLSGAPFRADWLNGTITINNALYKIASVTDSRHLTLTSPAGKHAGAPYLSGGGGNVMEVDLNSYVDAETEPATGRGAAGVVIGSGGPAKSGTGLIVSASNPPANAWRNGVVVDHFSRVGIAAVNPAANTANGLSISNGSAGSSEIRGGNPVLSLTGSPANLLKITPSVDDLPRVVAYGTNMDNNVVRWSITQGGCATFSTLILTQLPVFEGNAAARAGGLVPNQLYRTAAGALMVAY
jgi:glycosyltransferase involved in cell wall biosynthesis